MDNYRAMVQERADLIAEAKAVYAEDRALTDAERDRDDAIKARVSELNDHIDRVNALRDMERKVDANPYYEERVAEAAASTPAQTETPTPFRNLGEQLKAIAGYALNPTLRNAGVENLMTIQAAAPGGQEVVGSDGGFLVQTDFTSELVRRVHETGKLSMKTDRKPISANANGMKINAVDESSRADGSRSGGVRAYWTGEAAAFTDTKPKFRQMELSLQKLTGLYYATDELLADTMALDAFISDEFSKEFGFKMDDAIYRGDGAGMPLGVLGHAGTINVTKETGQPAATVVAENIEKMYARMWAPALDGAEWYINQDVWPQLFQLSHAVGTGGVPMFMLPGGITNAPNGALLGKPVVPLEHCETLGTSGDLMLGNFREYLMIEKGGMEFASSIHVQFLTDQMTFRFILRADGQPKHNSALTPFKGTNTQSAFITLATRS